MSLNRTAKGIVLVPSLLLGGAFLSAAIWQGESPGSSRPLALGIGAVLLAGGLLTQLLPDSEPERPSSETPGQDNRESTSSSH